MSRRRFSNAEKIIFMVGVAIEWRNGSHWHPGKITGSAGTDSIGLPYYPIKHTGPTTRTISHGQEMWGYPGNIRVPVTTA